MVLATSIIPRFLVSADSRYDGHRMHRLEGR